MKTVPAFAAIALVLGGCTVVPVSRPVVVGPPVVAVAPPMVAVGPPPGAVMITPAPVIVAPRPYYGYRPYWRRHWH